MDMNPVLGSGQTTLMKVGTALDFLDKLADQSAAVQNRPPDPRLTPQAVVEDKQKAREEAQRAGREYLQKTNIIAEVDKAIRDLEALVVVDAYLRRSNANAQTVVDSTERLRFQLIIHDADAEELTALFTDAEASATLWQIGSLIREAKKRARQPGATVDDRGLAAEFIRRASALELPELAKAREQLTWLRAGREWLDDGARALVTCDNPGRRERARWVANRTAALQPPDMPGVGGNPPARPGIYS